MTKYIKEYEKFVKNMIQHALKAHENYLIVEEIKKVYNKYLYLEKIENVSLKTLREVVELILKLINESDKKQDKGFY